jgi:ubiquinone/menaquinone biosynthesis C-methylase UbiE
MSTIVVDWDRYAVQYDEVTMGGCNPAYQELVEKVADSFRFFDLGQDSLVADLGGGTANFSIRLAERCPHSHFVVVDSSQIMLEIAREKADRKGIRNLETVLADVEDIPSITEMYSRPLTHAIMIHCLYATRSREDPDKPDRILKKLHDGLENEGSRLIISDINRPLRTSDWIPYCLWNAFIQYRNQGNGLMQSMLLTRNLFQKNDQSKLANHYIDDKQNEGSYLMATLDEFTNMIKGAGFSSIYERSDRFYRGRDNFIIAGK